MVRRVTKDLRTGAVIDDDHKVLTIDNKYLTREIPQAPRDVRTIFYYPKSSTTDPDEATKGILCEDEAG